MAAALVGADAARYAAPDQGSLAGMLLETFVAMELVKQATWSSEAVELFFYRDTEKREVDVVIESAAGDVAAIETKAAASVTNSDIRGLELLRAKLGARFKAGIVVYSLFPRPGPPDHPDPRSASAHTAARGCRVDRRVPALAWHMSQHTRSRR